MSAVSSICVPLGRPVGHIAMSDTNVLLQ